MASVAFTGTVGTPNQHVADSINSVEDQIPPAAPAYFQSLPASFSSGSYCVRVIHKREIVVVPKGRRVHLDRNDLDRWIEANKE